MNIAHKRMYKIATAFLSFLMLASFVLSKIPIIDASANEQDNLYDFNTYNSEFLHSATTISTPINSPASITVITHTR